MSLSSPGQFSENIREISKEKKEAILEEAKAMQGALLGPF